MITTNNMIRLPEDYAGAVYLPAEFPADLVAVSAQKAKDVLEARNQAIMAIQTEAGWESFRSELGDAQQRRVLLLQEQFKASCVAVALCRQAGIEL